MQNIYRKFIKLLKEFNNNDGFSLLEISIVITIIGVLSFIVIKGFHLIEHARLQETVRQISSFESAIISFQSQYGYLPGDFPEAQNQFGAASKNGNGNGIIDAEEEQLVWIHLKESGIANFSGISAIGAYISIKHSPSDDMQGHWLVLGDGGFFTPSQAKFIADKLGSDNSPISYNVKVKSINDKGIKDNKYDLTIKEKVCVIYYKICQ